jgi:hypothetical protein
MSRLVVPLFVSVTRRTSAASAGTTAISVRVSMSPSSRCSVTRSVASSASYRSAGTPVGWWAADQTSPERASRT